jgi:hypothetical protein
MSFPRTPERNAAAHLASVMLLFSSIWSFGRSLETIQQNFTRKMAAMEVVHLEIVYTDFASIDSWKDIAVHFVDYDLKNDRGRNLYTLLSNPSICYAIIRDQGVENHLFPARTFLRPSPFPKPPVSEDMQRQHVTAQWVFVEELTQRIFLRAVTNAFAAIVQPAPENSVLLKYTNQTALVELLYDSPLNIILQTTTTLTNGNRIFYEYRDFRPTSAGIFPYFLRYTVPETAFHTRELRATKFKFSSALDSNILSFEIPLGSRVEDHRFDPALGYSQGRHQYTDEELIGLAADVKAGKVVRIGQDAEPPIYEPPRAGRTTLHFLLIGCAVLLPIAIFVMRRKHP